MPDLYASRLPLEEEGPSGFARAVSVIKHSIAREAEAILAGPEGTIVLSRGSSIRWRLLKAPGLEDCLWTLCWQEALHHDRAILTVHVGFERYRTWVIVRFGHFPVGRRAAPVQIDVDPPILTRTLAETLVLCQDGCRLAPEPWHVNDGDSVAELLDLVLDPARVLPVVVVAPAGANAGSPRKPLVDPGAVARALLGLAHVASLCSDFASYRVADALGPDLATPAGAVRLYRPGLSSTGDPGQHPMWLPHQLASTRDRPIWRILLRQLCSVTVTSFVAADLESRILGTWERQRREDARSFGDRADGASSPPGLGEELELEWDEAQLRQENRSLLAQITTMQ